MNYNKSGPNKKRLKNIDLAPDVQIKPNRYINEGHIVEVQVKVLFTVPWMLVEKIESLPGPNNTTKSNVHTFATPLKAAKDSPVTALITVIQGCGVINIHCREQLGKTHVFTKDYYIIDPSKVQLRVNNSEEDNIYCNEHDDKGWFEIDIETMKKQELFFKSKKPFTYSTDLDEESEESDEDTCHECITDDGGQLKIYFRPSEKWQEIEVTCNELIVNLILIKRSKS